MIAVSSDGILCQFEEFLFGGCGWHFGNIFLGLSLHPLSVVDVAYGVSRVITGAGVFIYKLEEMQLSDYITGAVEGILF